jgi:hypothetical protein
MTDVEAKLKRKVGTELDVSNARARGVSPKPIPIPKNQENHPHLQGLSSPGIPRPLHDVRAAIYIRMV